MGYNIHEKLLIKNYLSKIHSEYHQHKNRINEIAKHNQKKSSLILLLARVYSYLNNRISVFFSR